MQQSLPFMVKFLFVIVIFRVQLTHALQLEEEK
jgi:hypothetical protein